MLAPLVAGIRAQELRCQICATIQAFPLERSGEALADAVVVLSPELAAKRCVGERHIIREPIGPGRSSSSARRARRRQMGRVAVRGKRIAARWTAAVRTLRD